MSEVKHHFLALTTRVFSFVTTHRRQSVVFAFVSLLGILFIAAPAYAQIDSSVIFNGILQGVSWMLLKLANIFMGLTVFGLKFFIELARYNNFIDAPPVVIGWVMVRDLANMCFIVVLLVIAFGTILGAESYEWKKLLAKMVFAAIFINFSKLIAQLIVDVAHVFTMTFLNAVSATAGGNLINMFHLQGMLKIVAQNPGATDIRLDLFAASVLALVFSAMAMATMFAYVVVMAARVVVLWVLFVLAPFAYILGVIPAGKGYADEYWQNFTKHVIVAPVMVFFLWLSFATLGNGTIANDIGLNMSATQNLANGAVQDSSTVNPSTSILEVTTWENMASFIIAIAFMAIGLGAVQKLGVKGGDFVGSAVGFAKNVAILASGFAAGRWLAKNAAVPLAKGVAMNIPLVGGKSLARKGRALGGWAGSKFYGVQRWRNDKAKDFGNKNKKLRDLAQQRDLGIITDEQYEKERGKLLKDNPWYKRVGGFVAERAFETEGRADKRAENWLDTMEARKEIVEKDYSTSSFSGGQAKYAARAELELVEENGKKKASRRMEQYRRKQYEDGKAALEEQHHAEEEVSHAETRLATLKQMQKDGLTTEGAVQKAEQTLQAARARQEGLKKQDTSAIEGDIAVHGQVILDTKKKMDELKKEFADPLTRGAMTDVEYKEKMKEYQDQINKATIKKGEKQKELRVFTKGKKDAVQEVKNAERLLADITEAANGGADLATLIGDIEEQKAEAKKKVEKAKKAAGRQLTVIQYKTEMEEHAYVMQKEESAKQMEGMYMHTSDGHRLHEIAEAAEQGKSAAESFIKELNNKSLEEKFKKAAKVLNHAVKTNTLGQLENKLKNSEKESERRLLPFIQSLKNRQLQQASEQVLKYEQSEAEARASEIYVELKQGGWSSKSTALVSMGKQVAEVMAGTTAQQLGRIGADNFIKLAELRDQQNGDVTTYQRAFGYGTFEHINSESNVDDVGAALAALVTRYIDTEEKAKMSSEEIKKAEYALKTFGKDGLDIFTEEIDGDTGKKVLSYISDDENASRLQNYALTAGDLDFQKNINKIRAYMDTSGEKNFKQAGIDTLGEEEWEEVLEKLEELQTPYVDSTGKFLRHGLSGGHTENIGHTLFDDVLNLARPSAMREAMDIQDGNLKKGGSKAAFQIHSAGDWNTRIGVLKVKMRKYMATFGQVKRANEIKNMQDRTVDGLLGSKEKNRDGDYAILGGSDAEIRKKYGSKAGFLKELILPQLVGSQETLAMVIQRKFSNISDSRAQAGEFLAQIGDSGAKINDQEKLVEEIENILQSEGISLDAWDENLGMTYKEAIDKIKKRKLDIEDGSAKGRGGTGSTSAGGGPDETVADIDED